MSTEIERLLSRRNFIKGAVGAGAFVGLFGLAACGEKAVEGDGGTTETPVAETPEAPEFPLGKTQIQALGGGVCGSPTYVAKDKGFWADEGIDVELVAGTFAAQQAGLASGQFLVTNGDFQFFPAVNEGLDIKIIGGMHEGCIKLLVPGDSPIKSVADLKGKTIGVDEIGGTPWAITSVALANAGIDPSAEGGEVTWAPYDLTVLAEVAARGEVDAFAAWDPFGTQAEQEGFRVLVDIGSTDIFAGRYCCFLWASNEAITKTPEKVKALLAGWQRAVEWVSANPAEAAKLITDSSEHEAYVSSDDTELLTTLLTSYHYKDHHGTDNQSQAKEDAEYFAGELKKTGYLPTDLDVTAFVDNIWVDVSKL